jgi:hypothetical protein
MRGGALPPSLLAAALGLALASAPPRVWAWSLVALGAAMAMSSSTTLPSGWLEIVFLGCWTSTAVTAASVHLPRGPGSRGAIVLSINAGIWSGAVVALSGSRPDLVKSACCILLALPISWLVARRASIALKVASSWLIAIAILAAALPFLPVTPGYLPDHLE